MTSTHKDEKRPVIAMTSLHGGKAVPPYEIRNVFKQPGRIDSEVVAHIVLDGKSLCGRDASNWSTRFNRFDARHDCRVCAKKAGLTR